MDGRSNERIKNGYKNGWLDVWVAERLVGCVGG